MNPFVLFHVDIGLEQHLKKRSILYYFWTEKFEEAN